MKDRRTDSITLDRDINEHSQRFKRSLNQVRWSHTLMQLFWTAGPVTGLGLVGGYYIGFGRFPSVELLIYFISFTALSGLIGLIAKIIYDTTLGYLKEQGERDILEVTDKLGDLILATRDMIVQGYEGDARKREAALQLLRRIDLSPYGVSIAFADLTGNREVGEILGRIYAYRRIGLYSRARELYADHHLQIDEIVRELAQSTPDAARELREWFTGSTFGTSKYGVPREPFFLQRVMSSIEYNNPYLMTFRDVEEVIILAFELISGREIPILTFQYTGRWKFARALDELEAKRSQYRVYQARGGNRMRALAAYLIETGYVTTEDIPDGQTIHQLIESVTRTIDALADDINKVVSNPAYPEKELQRLVGHMKTSIELYGMAHKAYRETWKRYEQLVEASEKWEKITSEAYGSPGSLRLGSGRRGIRIQENTISLDVEARLEVCGHLAWYFERLDVHKTGFVFTSPVDAQTYPDHQSVEDGNGSMAARRLAIEIALALEAHIKLSKPEIQRNINATRAIYLGELSPDMNAAQKAEIGQRMSKEADDRLENAAEQLAETLVRLYHVDLTEEAKDFLHYTYGARTEVLEQIESQDRITDNPAGNLKDRAPLVDPPKKYWTKTLINARKKLSKTSKQS